MYKDRMTNIVIEDKKSKKIAGNGQSVYGPFDESSTKDSAVQSYVVYDTINKTWTGYLQGDGGVKLSSSSYLFYNFPKVTEIEGIQNLNTTNVTTMYYMFGHCEQLQSLDLSHFNTSSVENMSLMFSYMSNLTSLTFGENFDTSSVTDMSWMFNGCSQLQELDLSNFNTSKVTDMDSMFSDAKNLSKITYGPNFIHRIGASVNYMFSNCPANTPNASVHSSWGNVFS